jgi:putative endonuclease
MPLFARVMFGLVNLAARRGLAGTAGDGKQSARRAGVRGETFAYWYLRRHGYVIIARNFIVPGIHGEIDLAGYDGDVLAFVEVKLRASAAEENAAARPRRALPEDAITSSKRRNLSRMAKQFLLQWRIRDTKFRFDVLAIETDTGARPIVRLHKDAFTADA